MESEGAAPDSGGESGASSAPAASTSDGGAATPLHGDASPATGEGSAPTEGSSDKPAPKVEKISARAFGRDWEGTQDELMSMISDDYEHTFKVGEAERKLRWNDIQRAVELSDGALTRMREAATKRKEVEGLMAQAKEDPAWFLREHLGQDPNKWASDLVYEEMRRNQELQELQQKNPAAAIQRMQELEREKVRREEAARQTREKAERDAAERARVKQEFEEAIPGHFKEAGLPDNAMTRSLFYSIGREYHEVGNPLPPQHVAQMAREQWDSMHRSYLEGMDDERLPAHLGDKMRERLRKLEVAALKQAGKARPANDNAEPMSKDEKAARGKPGKQPVSLSEWAKRFS